MTTSQALITRYSELVDGGELETAFNYLSPDVIYNSWLGMAEGRDNVITFMRDNIRFSHHARGFNHWKQVQHCLEPAVIKAPSGGVFDENGYDSEGYATFERDGKITSHAKFYVSAIPVKETVVFRGNSIILINHAKRL